MVRESQGRLPQNYHQPRFQPLNLRPHLRLNRQLLALLKSLLRLFLLAPRFLLLLFQHPLKLLALLICLVAEVSLLS